MDLVKQYLQARTNCMKYKFSLLVSMGYLLLWSHIFI